MKISFLQLNIFGGTYWEKLIHFLSESDIDVIHLQEIAGKGTRCGVVDSTRDCYAALQSELGERYASAFVMTDRFTSSPEAYFGNAIFYKKKFELQSKHILWLHQNTKPFPSDSTTFETNGKALIHVVLSLVGKDISFLNVHGAWAKAKAAEEYPHQTKQGEILLNYLNEVSRPFVLSGDFNLNPEQPTIKKIGELARNLTSEHHVTNTLNPRTHYGKHLFPPGIAVDYIFASKDIEVKSFNVLEEDISDHLGLVAEFEL